MLPPSHTQPGPVLQQIKTDTTIPELKGIYGLLKKYPTIFVGYAIYNG